MSFRDIVPTLGADAEQLELTYQAALAAGEADTFAEAIVASHAAAPDNLLYAAWFYRLAYAATRVKGFAVAWVWVVPLALLNGLLFWWLSDDQRFTIRMTNQLTGATYDFVPTLLLLAAPVSAAIVLVYLTAAGSRRWGPATVIGLGPLAATAYVLWAYPSTGTRPFQEQYLTLMALHLPVLAWAGVGYFLTTGHRDPASRFAFLIRSLEIFVMAGLFVIAGGLFTGITVGLFSALDIDFPVLVQRLFIAGGGGLIPVVATAVLYNPRVSPAAQAFEDGLSQSVALLMRVLLPLTLLVLLVYLGFIPFNFREPFGSMSPMPVARRAGRRRHGWPQSQPSGFTSTRRAIRSAPTQRPTCAAPSRCGTVRGSTAFYRCS